MNEFEKLYHRFKESTKWIECEYQKRGWTDVFRSYDQDMEKNIKDFELLVLGPLEEAWSKLSNEEKLRFEI